jgi:hypothetical protein
VSERSPTAEPDAGTIAERLGGRRDRFPSQRCVRLVAAAETPETFSRVGVSEK